jgi:hypothetical protein
MQILKDNNFQPRFGREGNGDSGGGGNGGDGGSGLYPPQWTGSQVLAPYLINNMKLPTDYSFEPLMHDQVAMLRSASRQIVGPLEPVTSGLANTVYMNLRHVLKRPLNRALATYDPTSGQRPPRVLNGLLRYYQAMLASVKTPAAQKFKIAMEQQGLFKDAAPTPEVKFWRTVRYLSIQNQRAQLRTNRQAQRASRLGNFKAVRSTV